MTGPTTGSSTGSTSIQENWNTPISELKNQFGTGIEKYQDYFLVTKSKEGRTEIFSNQSKENSSSLLSNIAGVFSKESEPTT